MVRKPEWRMVMELLREREMVIDVCLGRFLDVVAQLQGKESMPDSSEGWE